MSKARVDGNERVVDQSMQLLEESINKLRSVTNELENSTLQNEGFQKATEKLLNTIMEFQPIHCNFYTKGVEKDYILMLNIICSALLRSSSITL